jgi:hypothetical protein
MSPNLQDANVGNRGDIVKHAALVALATLLRARNAGPVRHVETHTFRLTAPLPDPALWSSRVAELGLSDHAYAAIEAPWAAQGRYRCSAGLVADTLGAPLSLLLAEAHAPTRALLQAALAEEGLPVDALVDDALALAALPPGAPAPLLVHVDPFDHPAGYWPVVAALLDRWRLPAHDAVVLSFAYDKRGPIAWPPPPPGLSALGRLDLAPYGLAAWASPGIAADARSALAALGWAAA